MQLDQLCVREDRTYFSLIHGRRSVRNTSALKGDPSACFPNLCFQVCMRLLCTTREREKYIGFYRETLSQTHTFECIGKLALLLCAGQGVLGTGQKACIHKVGLLYQVSTVGRSWQLLFLLVSQCTSPKNSCIQSIATAEGERARELGNAWQVYGRGRVTSNRQQNLEQSVEFGLNSTPSVVFQPREPIYTKEGKGFFRVASPLFTHTNLRTHIDRLLQKAGQKIFIFIPPSTLVQSTPHFSHCLSLGNLGQPASLLRMCTCTI